MKIFLSLCLVTSLGVATVVFYAAPCRTQARTPDIPRVLDVRGILLRDDRGNVRARLEVDSHGSPSLTLLDGANRKRIALSLSPSESASIALLDGTGKTRLAMTLQEGARPLVTGFGSKGQRLYEWGVEADDAVQQLFYDRDGNQRLKLRVGSEGRAQLRLAGSNGQPGLRTDVTDRGDARQSLFDRNGNERIQITTESDRSMMNLLSPRRKIRVATALFENGTGEYLVCDEEGKRRLSFSVNAKGIAKALFLGTNGKGRLEVSTDAESSQICSRLRLFDLNGLPKVALGVDSDGSPFALMREGEEGRVSKHLTLTDLGVK